ncbi:MAG: hypothetical protein WCJ14_09345 [Verrucomicrobiota bacterium]
MNTRKRILVVDDHPLVRSGLFQAIAAAGELEVCGEAGGWNEALEKRDHVMARGATLAA